MEAKQRVAPPPAEAQGGSDPSNTAEREECSFDEAIARYEGEWVVMKITEVGEFDYPERGIVIAHSPDRGAISEALTKEPPRRRDAPSQPYYTFNAFFRIRPNETEEEAVVRVAAHRVGAKEAPVSDSGRSVTFPLVPSFEEIRGQRLLVVRLTVG